MQGQACRVLLREGQVEEQTHLDSVGHGGRCGDHARSVLIFQSLVEDLHVQEAMKPAKELYCVSQCNDRLCHSSCGKQLEKASVMTCCVAPQQSTRDRRGEHESSEDTCRNDVFLNDCVSTLLLKLVMVHILVLSLRTLLRLKADCTRQENSTPHAACMICVPLLSCAALLRYPTEDQQMCMSFYTVYGSNLCTAGLLLRLFPPAALKCTKGSTRRG